MTYEITGSDYCWLLGFINLKSGNPPIQEYDLHCWGPPNTAYFTNQDGYDRLHDSTR